MADEATPAANYLVAHGQALVALDRAIADAFAAGNDLNRPTDERADAFARAIDLGKQKQRLQTTHEMFQQRLLLPNPPSSEVIGRATAIATRLAEEVSRDILATGKLEVVVGIISAFAELVNTSKPAAPDADTQTASPTPNAEAMTVLELETSTSNWLKVMRSRE